MHSDLLPFLRTTEDVSVFCWELDELEKSLYMTDRGGWEEILSSKVRFNVAEILKNYIPQDLESKVKILREIKEEALSLPVVRLTLAIDPTEELVVEISEKLRKWINPSVVIDILRDSLIVGGVIITCNGKFTDYSICTKIDQAWSNNSERWLKEAYGESK